MIENGNNAPSKGTHKARCKKMACKYLLHKLWAIICVLLLLLTSLAEVIQKTNKPLSIIKQNIDVNHLIPLTTNNGGVVASKKLLLSSKQEIKYTDGDKMNQTLTGKNTDYSQEYLLYNYNKENIPINLNYSTSNPTIYPSIMNTDQKNINETIVPTIIRITKQPKYEAIVPTIIRIIKQPKYETITPKIIRSPKQTPPDIKQFKKTTKTAISSNKDIHDLFPKPFIITRENWGSGIPPEKTNRVQECKITHIVVHHTVTPNQRTQSTSNLLRGIENFHVKSRNFPSIAYRVLIDNNGDLYEGFRRKRFGPSMVLEGGAASTHARNFNCGSFGIALIGDYSKISSLDLKSPVIQSLIKTIVYVATRQNRLKVKYDDKGNLQINMIKIIGHNETGRSNTSCPGSSVSKILPYVKEEVYKRIKKMILNAR